MFRCRRGAQGHFSGAGGVLRSVSRCGGSRYIFLVLVGGSGIIFGHGRGGCLEQDAGPK